MHDLTACLQKFTYKGRLMVRILSDQNVYRWSGGDGVYLLLAIIVDDFLVAYKGGDDILDALEAHLKARWTIHRFSLNGFLNNEFYFSPCGTTLIMCMIRL